MKHALTKRQAEALAFIKLFIYERGYGPSVEEIAKGLGITAKSGAHRLVVALERRGYITRLEGKSRSIALVTSERDELAILRRVKEAADLFIKVQENFRTVYEVDPASEASMEGSQRVGAAFENLKGLVRGLHEVR